jgi:hypothetical protein
MLSRRVLELNRDVLENMTQPGPFFLRHSPDEPTGFPVRAPMLRKPRQEGEQAVDKLLPEARRWPILEWAKIHYQPDNREMGVQTRALIDSAF